MTSTGRPVHPGAAWTWTALTLVGCAASFLVAFGVLAGVRLGPVSVDGPRLDLALFLAMAGTLSLLGVVGSARLAFGRSPTAAPIDLLLAGSGMLLAIAVELALHEWARVHIGYYDVDFVGWTAALSTLVVLTAVAGFSVRLAPEGAVAPPLIGAVLAAAMLGLIVASNVPGLGDGIEPESWPLAILIGLSAAYATASVIIGLRRLRAD